MELYWAVYCVSSAKFFVLVNSCLKGYFGCGRVLKQGNPLSPLLFSLVAEVFGRMCNKAEIVGKICGFLLSRGVKSVPYLQYVDDIIVFYGTSYQEVINLTCILGWSLA